MQPDNNPPFPTPETPGAPTPEISPPNPPTSFNPTTPSVSTPVPTPTPPLSTPEPLASSVPSANPIINLPAPAVPVAHGGKSVMILIIVGGVLLAVGVLALILL